MDKLLPGKRGYLDADFNRNAQVNNLDKNRYWLPNQNTELPGAAIIWSIAL